MKNQSTVSSFVFNNRSLFLRLRSGFLVLLIFQSFLSPLSVSGAPNYSCSGFETVVTFASAGMAQPCSLLGEATDTIGALKALVEQFGAVLDQLGKNIESIGQTAEGVIVVASDETQDIIRVTGNEVAEVAERLSQEGQDVIAVISDETQEVLHVTGEETRSLVQTVGTEAQEFVVVASNESQQIIRVTGEETRLTLDNVAKNTKEVILVASKEIKDVVSLTGEEARKTIQTVGDETRKTLDLFHENNEEMLGLISDLYQENLDITIDSLDEGSRKALRNLEQALFQANELFVQDLYLINTASLELIHEISAETIKVITEIEQSTNNLVIAIGETTVYVIDRTTNNVITLLSLMMLGVGILLFIYLFFSKKHPEGVSAVFVYGFILLFLLGFGTFVFSPTARAYAMTSTQIGIKAELEKSFDPEVVLYSPNRVLKAEEIVTVELVGRNLLPEGTPPEIQVNGQMITVAPPSETRITFNIENSKYPDELDEFEIVVTYPNKSPYRIVIPRLVSAYKLPEPPKNAELTITTEGGADVYNGPDDLNYNLLGTAPQGETYIIQGSNSDQSWWAIRWEGGFSNQGWVPNFASEASGNLLDVPTVPVSSLAPTSTPIPTVIPPTPTPTITPLASIFIISVDNGMEGTKTSAHDIESYLSPVYSVTVWSIAVQGLPTDDDVARYDLYIIDSGNYAFNLEFNLEIFGALTEVEAPVWFIGAQPLFAPETETIVDLEISDPAHPILAGLTNTSFILSDAVSGIPEQLFHPEDFDTSDGTVFVILARGPGNATPGGPVLFAGDDGSAPRSVIAALPLYRLPFDVQKTLTINIVAWLLGE